MYSQLTKVFVKMAAILNQNNKSFSTKIQTMELEIKILCRLILFEMTFQANQFLLNLIEQSFTSSEYIPVKLTAIYQQWSVRSFFF